MPLFDRDVTTPFDSMNSGAIPLDVFGVAINWFANRTPLISRLPKLPVGSPTFVVINDNYRPRTASVTAAIDNASTSVNVADGSMFDLGDVIELEGEQMLVTAVVANTLTVVRGYGGTAAAAHASGLSAYLITNTRTGAEVNIQALSRIPNPTVQYCQTVQHAYQVGGALQSVENFVSGIGTPLDRDRMIAMQNCMDDFEQATYYGVGVPISSPSTRPQMKGLRKLINSNQTSAPVNAAAYKPSDLVRDTIQKCFDGGGNPNFMLVSTDFLTGFAVWGHAVQRLEAGATVFGTPIDLFEVPFLSGISLVPAPLLRPGTAICLSGPEVRVRLKRPLFEKPRGSRGDAVEGDFIMEGAIEIDNEAHHAWVSGITAFAAS
jgi:hypothetical protein